MSSSIVGSGLEEAQLYRVTNDSSEKNNLLIDGLLFEKAIHHINSFKEALVVIKTIIV